METDLWKTMKAGYRDKTAKDGLNIQRVLFLCTAGEDIHCGVGENLVNVVKFRSV